MQETGASAVSVWPLFLIRQLVLRTFQVLYPGNLLKTPGLAIRGFSGVGKGPSQILLTGRSFMWEGFRMDTGKALMENFGSSLFFRYFMIG